MQINAHPGWSLPAQLAPLLPRATDVMSKAIMLACLAGGSFVAGTIMSEYVHPLCTRDHTLSGTFRRTQ